MSIETEYLEELSALAENLAEDALLLELLTGHPLGNKTAVSTLRRLSDYLTQHTGELQVVARCLASHSSRVSI